MPTGAAFLDCDCKCYCRCSLPLRSVVQIKAAMDDIAAMSDLAVTQLQLPLGSAGVITNGRTVIDFNAAAGNSTMAPGMSAQVVGGERADSAIRPGPSFADCNTIIVPDVLAWQCMRLASAASLNSALHALLQMNKPLPHLRASPSTPVRPTSSPSYRG